MNSLRLYLRYAFRSFLRGRSRSVFGAFCVAVGITSVVALGLVGGNFHNALVGNAKKINRGDVSASPAGLGFTLQQAAIFPRLKAEGMITGYTYQFHDDGMIRSTVSGGPSAIGTLNAVDPRVFPFYDTIRADQPAGVPLSQLLANPENVVVSHDVLNTLHLKIGDRVGMDSRRGFNHVYRIAGVVPDNAPDPNFGGGFFDDFVIANSASTQTFFHDLNIGAGKVFVTTKDAAQAAAVKNYLSKHLGGFPSLKTVADVEKDSRDGSASFNTFFRLMGLVAVVIGGIGIINTTLVTIRRRRQEIAVLKSLGMKGRQVIAVFTIEALILGLTGTAVGVAGGIGASKIVNSATENIAGYPIPWSIQASPIIAGVLVGLVGTVLFSYLPVVAASRARPMTVLRPDFAVASGRSIRRGLRTFLRHPLTSTGRGLRRAPRGILRLPRRQGVRTAFLVVLLAVLAGYLAALYAALADGPQTLITGAMIGIGTLVAAGAITQIFVFTVYLVSKLPSLGRLSVRMALRSMGTQKRRLGSTLLALCVGVLSVGSVSILSQNLRSWATNAADHQFRVNVVIQAPYNAAIERRVAAEVATLPGIEHRDVGAVSNSAIPLTVDGHNIQSVLQLKDRRHKISRDTLTQVIQSLNGLEGRDLRYSHYNLTMLKGRALGPQDSGTDHLVINQQVADAINAHVGSRIVFADGNLRIPFQVAGINGNQDWTIFSQNAVDSTYMNRMGLNSPSHSHLQLTYLRVQPASIDSDVSVLRHQLPGAMVLNMNNFLSGINKAVDKMTVFPMAIAALSLFAGVVIIANTVALAMMERRREIAVMKAVGARRRTILQFLFVENAIVGLLGALAGVGLSMVATAVVAQNFLQIPPSYDPLTIAGLLLMGMVLAVAASAVTAYPASSEKPMNILRYE